MDSKRASLLVIGEDCAALRKALASGSDDVLFGRAIAVLDAPGRYAITFVYSEQEAHGFVPAQPLHVVASPVQIDFP